MATPEKSTLKFNREIKKAMLLKQREIAHQLERFNVFYQHLSLEESIQLVPYRESQAYKQILNRDSKSVLNPLTKHKEIRRELNHIELREFGGLIASLANEKVFLFSVYDYSFPSVLISLDYFFDNYESILDLMENQVEIVFCDMQDALLFDNEDGTNKVVIKGCRFS